MWYAGPGLAIQQTGIGTVAFNIVDTIWHCPEPTGMRRLYVESKILTLLSLQCEALVHNDTPAVKPLKLLTTEIDKLYYVRDLLCSRLNNPPSLHELSKICALNEFKIKKGFRQLFRNSVFGFVNEYRLQEAQRMIYEGQKNMSTIAYELGYAHPQHFQRAFSSGCECLLIGNTYIY